VVAQRARTAFTVITAVLVFGLLYTVGAASAKPGLSVPKSPVSSPSGLKIADFEAGSNNTYVQTRMKAVRAEVAKNGAKVDIFDPNWDINTEVNQIQSAITSKKYNAFIIQAIEPDPACNIAKSAIAAGILVLVANQPLCGSTTYMPGTVGFVGGQTLGTYKLWMKWILDDNKAGGHALLITGPAGDVNRRNLLAAFDQLKGNYPKFSIVSNQPTDYSTAKAYTIAQDTLLAKKDINVVITNWSGSTQGVVQAIAAMKLNRPIMIYDLGANQWAVAAVRDGKVRMTFPLLPALEGQRSIDSLAKYVSTGKVAGFVDLVHDPSFHGKLPFITKANAPSYKAQF
jgi:ribose transport system substrate-binding protein